MRIRIIIMLLFFSFTSLEAQSHHNALIVRNFSGGQGSDARNLAAGMERQYIIQNNFTVVYDERQAVYAIDGIIQREGIGFIAHISIKRIRDFRELGKENVYYKDVLEAVGALPVIAAKLALTVYPRINVNDDFKALAEGAGNSFSSSEIPPSHVKKPEPGKVLPPMEPDRSLVASIIEPVPVRTELPKSPQISAPEKLPKDSVSKQYEMAEWRRNILYLGLWLGATFTGDSLNFMIEADFKPIYDVSWFGLKLGAGVANGLGTGDNITVSDFSVSNRTSISDAYVSPLFYFAPKLRFGLGNTDLGLFAGPGFSMSASDLRTYDSYGSALERRTIDNVFLGIFLGVELDIKLGGGCLFFTLNGGALSNTVSPNLKQVSNVRYESMKEIAYFNFGAGYRFGLLKK